MMSQTRTVAHRGVTLVFSVPNSLNNYRVETFATKEPETLAWIDAMQQRSVVWDIGANVGLYSCYAATQRYCKVFAFEPSVFNLELLARNIVLNDLTDLVTIIPLPLAEKVVVSKLNLTTTTWGGALSTFGESFGYDGKPLCKKFEFSTIGVSVNDAHDLLGIPKPEYMKIDVDGIEHLIVKGGTDVLKHVHSVLVEINYDFQEQAESTKRHLLDAGLELKETRQWKGATDDPSGATCNQIWRRPDKH